VSFRFRKRRVRVHLIPVAGADDLDFEGVLSGKVDGHYQLHAAKLLQGGEASFSLDNIVEIPVERVWWLERLVSV
jgi:hypothetical protein